VYIRWFSLIRNIQYCIFSNARKCTTDGMEGHFCSNLSKHYMVSRNGRGTKDGVVGYWK
jgi:hypothetical protein